ncbi:hypothetical protein Z043_125210 [Scleropages formosus]|uniref:Uncharacterized protein n=1 Tax=Scleropages formosus TaxID=113540 RepID=A0A0N8JV43_SCLFO|nr:hypothetical protein Z043_125210 [Scleropages formosus]
MATPAAHFQCYSSGARHLANPSKRLHRPSIRCTTVNLALTSPLVCPFFLFFRCFRLSKMAVAVSSVAALFLLTAAVVILTAEFAHGNTPKRAVDGPDAEVTGLSVPLEHSFELGEDL